VACCAYPRVRQSKEKADNVYLSCEEKLEAIKALVDGEYDNVSILKVGPLFSDLATNIKLILSM
jgi:hypothetical protein